MSARRPAAPSRAINPSASEESRPVLDPPASLGVIGSGQLGRMFVQAAQRMGFRTGGRDRR